MYSCRSAVMSGLPFAPFGAFLLCSWIFVLCQGTQELKETVKPGDNATLQCQSHQDADITLIEWSRTDLKSDDYVFFFREGRSIENFQYPSFRGRVELRDPEMKNGDASVILKNVKTNDTGTYKCSIKERNKESQAKLISTIKLTVTGVNVGLIVGLTVFAVLLVGAVVGTMIFKKHRDKTTCTRR